MWQTRQRERERQGDVAHRQGDIHMATQEAEHSLESVVRGHHMYKYIWAPCLDERLSFRADGQCA